MVIDDNNSRKSRPKCGRNRGKGRVKGVPNKTTKAVKDALQEAFDGIGGVDALILWAKTEQTEFYKLWAKLLPTEVKAQVKTLATLRLARYR